MAGATRNAVLRDVADRYFALAAAERRREALAESEKEIAEIVRLTANFAKAGQGRDGDAERAKTEALLFHDETTQAEEEVAIASANLAELLGADPAVRLQTNRDALAPVQLIPPTIELGELIQTALANRPEVGAGAAAVAESRTRVRQERVRPLLPVIAVGFSAGSFGGGSNLVPYRFDHFAGRTDFDAVAVWSFQNIGIGNLALTRQRRAQMGEVLAEQQRVIDQIGFEVNEAYAELEARQQQIPAAARRLKAADNAYHRDLNRSKNLEGYPIELLNSVKLLSAARLEAIRAAIGFNQAQFRLLAAIGQSLDAAPILPSSK
jgi:outer membrane protein TolC